MARAAVQRRLTWRTATVARQPGGDPAGAPAGPRRARLAGTPARPARGRPAHRRGRLHGPAQLLPRLAARGPAAAPDRGAPRRRRGVAVPHRRGAARRHAGAARSRSAATSCGRRPPTGPRRDGGVRCSSWPGDPASPRSSPWSTTTVARTARRRCACCTRRGRRPTSSVATSLGAETTVTLTRRGPGGVAGRDRPRRPRHAGPLHVPAGRPAADLRLRLDTVRRVRRRDADRPRPRPVLDQTRTLRQLRGGRT